MDSIQTEVQSVKEQYNYSIIEVCGDEVQTVKNLLQAYEAEFSKVTLKEPGLDGIYPLDVKLEEHTLYLLKSGNVPVGVAVKGIVNGRHDICDFYIVPTYRRKKAGLFFAVSLVGKYKGPWQARQIEGYDLGRDFAVGCLEKLLGNDQIVQKVIEDPYWGKITVQYFESE